MNNINIDEVKDILKCSIDETTNMNEAIERTLQHIYLKGWNDAEGLKVNEILRKANVFTKADMVDILDKIRAEIEKRKEGNDVYFDDYDMQIYMIGLNTAIEIIDKYKTGCEDR